MTLKIRPNAIEQDFGPFIFPEVYVDGDLGVGTRTPTGKVHIHVSGTEIASAWTGLVVQHSSSGQQAALSLIGASDGVAQINFGIEADEDIGYIKYHHNLDYMSFGIETVEALRFTATEAIFNDGGADRDFRVESSGQVNMLFVDAGADAIGIGKTPVAQRVLDVYRNINDVAYIHLENPNAGTGAIAGIRTLSDTTNAQMLSHAGARTATRYGVTVGGWSELFVSTGNGLLIGSTRNVPIVFGTNSLERMRITNEGTIALKELAAAGADVATYGQIWVKTATPNQLWFTDDAGTDFQLGLGGGTGGWTLAGTFVHPTDTNDHVIVGSNAIATATIYLGADGAAVFNEQGADVDFRVESDTDTHALFVQGSDGFVGIGTNAPGGLIHMAADGAIDFIGTVGDDEAGNRLNIKAQSSRGTVDAPTIITDGGALLSITTQGWDGGAWRLSSQINFRVDGAPGVGSMPGLIEFKTTPTGTAAPVTRVLIYNDGTIVFNEGGADSDFRVESDTLTHALFVQGSDGFVGIGTSAPGGLFQVGDGTQTGVMIRMRAASGAGQGALLGHYNDVNTLLGLFGRESAWLGAGVSENTVLTAQGARAVLIGTNGSERVRVDSSGRVGIGIALPTSVLHIFGTTNWGQIKVQSSAVDGEADINFLASNDAVNAGYLIGKNISGVGNFDIWASAAGASRINIQPDGTIVFNEGGLDSDFRVESDTLTHALFVQGSDGFVGINCSTPSVALEINNAGNAELNIHSTTSGWAAIIELGAGGAGNRFAYIDLVGDATYTDYGFRIIRQNTGANTPTELIHRGTGVLNITSMENGSIAFKTANAVRFTVTAGGLWSPNGAPGPSIGDAANYVNDLSYKTLTDRGCLGWYEDGVELQDGSIVSDIEALKAIKKHALLLTNAGAPRLDYATMPKHVYKPAPIADEDVYSIDENPVMRYRKGEKAGDDGAELTALVSIMLGAIKELDSRLEAVEH